MSPQDIPQGALGWDCPPTPYVVTLLGPFTVTLGSSRACLHLGHHGQGQWVLGAQGHSRACGDPSGVSPQPSPPSQPQLPDLCYPRTEAMQVGGRQASGLGPGGQVGGQLF